VGEREKSAAMHKPKDVAMIPREKDGAESSALLNSCVG
jgi:hypothetical protein